MRQIRQLALTTFLAGAVWSISVVAQERPEWQATLGPRISDLSDRAEVRLVLVGDTGHSDEFETIAKGIARYCADGGCDLGLLLGDNFYRKPFRSGPRRSTSGSFTEYFYRPLSSLRAGFDFWALLGNHGYIWPGCPQAQIDHTYLAPRGDGPDWLMPDHSYSIPKLPAWLHVYGIDSYRVLKKKEGWQRQVRGIEEELCGMEGWRVLAGHHPFYTTGDHAKDEKKEQLPLRERLEPTLERCKTHLVLAGHDHHQQLIDAGSYIQVLQGAGSNLRPKLSGYELPEGVKSLGFWKTKGFGVATFREDHLDLRFFEVREGTQGSSAVTVTELLHCAWSRSDQEAGGAGWLERSCEMN